MLTPLPHQIEDAKFLAARRFAGCFSGMGTGKTVTALEALRIVRRNTDKARLPSLIIAPPIALQMWADSVSDQLGLDARILKTGATQLDSKREGVADVYVVSYAIAAKRPDLRRSWTAVICDESHALKSITAKRTKAVLGKGGIVCQAHHSWMLTGTPITRHADDLYPFLCRADLAGLKARCGGHYKGNFDLQFCITQVKQYHPRQRPVRVVVGSRRGDELREWLYEGGLAVRRTLQEVWDQMPPLSVSALTCALKMTPELRAALKALEGMPLSEVEQQLQQGDANLATTRRLIGQAKVAAATDYIADEVDSGNAPVLVGAWHRSVIDDLSIALADRGLRVAVIDGSTSANAKQQRVAQFNAKELDVLVGQIGAMGVSLNLQAGGNRIVTVEEDWSPTVMNQFYARLHRMGQRKAVVVHRLIGGTKLDKAIAKIAARKAHFAAVAVGTDGT